MADSDAKRLYARRVRDSLKRADEAFRGDYAQELEGLLGLSLAEIDAITPGTTDLETYDKLIVVVKEASRVNLEQAVLASRIRSLGDVAVEIAKKVPRLAAFV